MNSGPKRVLFVLPSLEGGGAERVVSTLLRHLDRGVFEPHLAVLQAAGPYRQDIPQDVVLHDLHAARVRYSLPKIVSVVRRVRPQAVLSTVGHLNLALILAKPLLPRGVKLLVREAASPNVFLPKETRHPRTWMWLYRHLYPRTDRIICLSDSMVDDMAVHLKLPRDKLVRIYNPVDAMRVEELARVGDNPFSAPGPHLVTAGRLSREKGFDILLSAMAMVRQHLSQAKLTVLGEGPLRAELTEQASRLGLTEVVRFPGFQQNPWPYFRHADVLVLSSRYEGLPNVVLEALVLGTPIVATDCPGGIKEIQAVCQEITMVPPEDPQALAQAIISVCHAAKRARGRLEVDAQALSKFSVSQIVGEYSKLLLG